MTGSNEVIIINVRPPAAHEAINITVPRPTAEDIIVTITVVQATIAIAPVMMYNSAGYDNKSAGYDNNSTGYDSKSAGYEFNSAGYDHYNTRKYTFGQLTCHTLSSEDQSNAKVGGNVCVRRQVIDRAGK